MNVNELKKGRVFKNWKDVCDTLSLSYRSKYSEYELSKYCKWHKEGRSVIIDSVFKIQLEDGNVIIINSDKLKSINVGQLFPSNNKLIKHLELPYHRNKNEKNEFLDYIGEYIKYESTNNKRAKNEIRITNVSLDKFIEPLKREDKRVVYNFYLYNESKEFKGYYVYAHYINDEIIYIGKGSKCRATSFVGRNYTDKNLTKIDIIKRFGDDEIGALKYEKELIEYYKSIGQCRYNDLIYHTGKLRNTSLKQIKLQTKCENLIKKRNELIERVNEINLKINEIRDILIE
ncbi:MAG: hypothetical protein RR359_03550 [Bacilli bacterium]